MSTRPGRPAPVRLLAAIWALVLAIALAAPVTAQEQPPPRPTFPSEPPPTTTTTAPRSSSTTTTTPSGTSPTTAPRPSPTTTPSGTSPTTAVPAANATRDPGSAPGALPSGPGPSQAGQPGGSGGLAPLPGLAPPAPPEAGLEGGSPTIDIGDPFEESESTLALEPLPEEPVQSSGLGLGHPSVVLAVLMALVVAAWALGPPSGWRAKLSGMRKR